MGSCGLELEFVLISSFLHCMVCSRLGGIVDFVWVLFVHAFRLDGIRDSENFKVLRYILSSNV
jgi:uncharacterized membrane protein